MNWRALLGSFLVVVGLAALWGVWSQRSQLAELRAEQRQLRARQAAPMNDSASHGTTEAGGASSGIPQPALVVTPELLRLRNEVTRLTERKRELAGVRADNAGLRAQVASRGTNGPGTLQLPPGYVRKSAARFAGYNSPDNTIQSLLWSIQNRDVTNLLQAFAPAQADQLREQLARATQSSRDFFSDAGSVPGMAILNRKQLSDGSIELEVEMAPGLNPAPIRMQQIGGQWKITAPF
jgi:hypothetical protein